MCTIVFLIKLNSNIRDISPAHNTAFIEGYARMIRQIRSNQPKVDIVIKDKKPKPGPSPLRKVIQGARKSMQGGFVKGFAKSPRKSLSRNRRSKKLLKKLRI